MTYSSLHSSIRTFVGKYMTRSVTMYFLESKQEKRRKQKIVTKPQNCPQPLLINRRIMFCNNFNLTI